MENMHFFLLRDLYVFLWTETGLAFLDRSRTEMGTPTQRLQVKKKVIKSPTSFYEYSFNNTTHYHVLKCYNFSCKPFIKPNNSYFEHQPDLVDSLAF